MTRNKITEIENRKIRIAYEKKKIWRIRTKLKCFSFARNFRADNSPSAIFPHRLLILSRGFSCSRPIPFANNFILLIESIFDSLDSNVVCGIIFSLMKLMNMSELYDPLMISQSIKPSHVYAGRIDHFFDHFAGDLRHAGWPFGDQPYLRSRERSFAADSSMYISWSYLNSGNRTICSHLRYSLRFVAIRWT